MPKINLFIFVVVELKVMETHYSDEKVPEVGNVKKRSCFSFFFSFRCRSEKRCFLTK